MTLHRYKLPGVHEVIIKFRNSMPDTFISNNTHLLMKDGVLFENSEVEIKLFRPNCVWIKSDKSHHD